MNAKSNAKTVCACKNKQAIFIAEKVNCQFLQIIVETMKPAKWVKVLFIAKIHFYMKVIT
jgi:hypothetical protein